jgi:hypothetical protein
MLHGDVEWEDLDIFFEEFAIDAVLQLWVTRVENIQEFNQIRGIFETPYLKRDFGAFIVDEEAPSFTCKWHDIFQYARKGDVLFLNQTYDRDSGDTPEDFYQLAESPSQVWYIDSIPQNDGTGVVSFILTPGTTQDEHGESLDDTIDEEPPTGGLFSPNPAAS